MIPIPEVSCTLSQNTDEDPEFKNVFPTCIATRAQARKFKDLLGLFDSCVMLDDPFQFPFSPLPQAADAPLLFTPNVAEVAHLDLSLPIDKVLIRREQESNPSLVKCRNAATKNVATEIKSTGKMVY